ncbi:Peptidase M16 inactive domain protein [Theileria parva strain Muguga]|uniref:Peptidase M16 inactive domain protein n=1 Tax=Theileria parva strain Muguga TaxID=333668 RepID=UPI001C61B88D|nr:Peptidase M16 inactive domain protein [Theileria parva strain Muguga]EAN31825.2 Peptidase M16 inactive domain protein [Theileria parva strain Muguga]
MPVLFTFFNNRSIILQCLSFLFIIINISQALSINLNKNYQFLHELNPRIHLFSFIRPPSQSSNSGTLNKQVFSYKKLFGREELLTENDVYRGSLENGLKYSFYKKDTPTLEAYLQVCSGSADEKDNQRGIAHLCEHVTYMGSKKRTRLCNYSVKTNAFTDYNQTVFFVKTDSELGCNTKKEKLHKVLDTLLDVVEAPSQFSQYELDKERKAVLSEAKIITTAEYYKNCNTVKTIHKENILPVRFPIGDLDMIMNYKVEDLKAYHSQHYIPDNIQLFIQGNLDETDVSETINDVFSKLENPPNLKEIRLLYKNTEKARRKGMPPVTHIYNQKEPVFDVWLCDKLPCFSFEILKKLPIPPIRTFSDYYNFILSKLVYKILSINFMIFKRDTQLYNNVEANDYDCVNEGCRLRSLDIKCDTGDWKNSVFYVISEIGRFLGECVSNKFLDYAKDALLYDFETKNYKENNTADFIENHICDRANLDKNQTIKLIKRSYDDIDPNNVLQRLNDMFSWYKGDLRGLKVLATTPVQNVTLEELRELFNHAITTKIKFSSLQVNLPDSLLDKKHVEEIKARSSDNIFPQLDKNFHKESFDYEGYLSNLSEPNKNLFKRYYMDFKEYLNLSKHVELCVPTPRRECPEIESILAKQFDCDLNQQENSHIIYNLLQAQKPLVRTQPCELYKKTLENEKTTDINTSDLNRNQTELSKSDPNNKKTESLSDLYDMYTLNNNVRVNTRRTDDNSVYLSANIPIYEYILNNRIPELGNNSDRESIIKTNKLMLLLISTSLMESGSMGSLDRKQVELFCELNSINVNISLNYDYLNISINVPFTSNNGENNVKPLEYSLQILNNILENYRITQDEFDRAKQKITSDHKKYIKDIKNYGIGELLHNMSGGILGFEGLEIDKLDEIKYETVVKETKKLVNSTAKEVNVVSNFDLKKLRKYVTQYLSSSLIVSKNTITDEAKSELNQLEFSKTSSTSHFLDNFESQLYYRKNMVKFFDDVTDKAIVLVGGHAPNASGFITDGTHISKLLENTFRDSSETKEDIDKLAIMRRELWMHPAFPKAASDLFSEALNSDLFMKLRTMKNLTYDTRLEVVTNDISDSFFVISAFSNKRNYPVILSEIINYLKRLSNQELDFGKTYLDNCKKLIKAKIKEKKQGYYAGNMSGIQLEQALTKNILSITEYEKVLDEITPEDFTLLMTSQGFGIDPHNMYTRVLYSGD